MALGPFAAALKQMARAPCAARRHIVDTAGAEFCAHPPLGNNGRPV